MPAYKEGKVRRNERLYLSSIRCDIHNVFFDRWCQVMRKKNLARRNERLCFVFDVIFLFNWWCQLVKKGNFARRNERLCLSRIRHNVSFNWADIIEWTCKEEKSCKVWRYERLYRYNVHNIFFNWWCQFIKKKNIVRRNQKLHFLFNIMFSSIDDASL